jgi:hypothetical protein
VSSATESTTPPASEPPDDLMTSDEVAARMRYDKTDRFLEHVRRPTEAWALTFPRPVKIGRRLLFRRSDVDAWIARHFDAAQGRW